MATDNEKPVDADKHELATAIEKLAKTIDANRGISDEVLKGSSKNLKDAIDTLSRHIEAQSKSYLKSGADISTIVANVTTIATSALGGITSSLGPLGATAVAGSIVILAGALALSVYTYSQSLHENSDLWKAKYETYLKLQSTVANAANPDSKEACGKSEARSIYDWLDRVGTLVANESVIEEVRNIAEQCESGHSPIRLDELRKAMRDDLGIETRD